jgi:hypothetical protein
VPSNQSRDFAATSGTGSGSTGEYFATAPGLSPCVQREVKVVRHLRSGCFGTDVDSHPHGIQEHAASASAQTPAPTHGQKYIGSVSAAAEIDLATRIDVLDQRIALLTADIRMFVGELKIQAMADLIEALIERQQLIERRLRPLDEWMMKRNASPFNFELEPEDSPEAMCSPFI